MLKRTIGAFLVVAMGLAGLSGCAEKASVTSKTETTTPGGTTTTTHTTEVKKTGENPPPAAP